MNTRIILLVISTAVFSSCSTMYKSGQTPDDVYFSPEKEGAAYVSTNDQKDESRYDNYTDVSSRYLRMKTYNRNRWSSFDDDYMYWNNPVWNNPYVFNSWYSRPMMGYNNWGYGGYGGYGHFGYNNFWGNSGYGYNPYFWNNPFGNYYYGNPVIILNPKPVYRNPVANGPRTFNLNTYANSNRRGYHSESTGRYYNNSVSGSNAPVRVFNNSGGSDGGAGTGGRYINTNSGSSQRGGYNPRSSGNNSETRNSNPVRTFDRGNNNNSNSGSRSSGSSGGSSGGSAPVRSFPRGGG